MNNPIRLMATAMIADNSFTRISPRQLQHYLLRTTYKPQTWLTFAGTTNILESRDNVQTVNHLEHNLNYAYDSVYSNTLECYTASPALPSAGTAPPVCVAAGTPLLSTGYYNQPTQYGVIGFMLAPVKRLHVNAGYRMSAVNGNSDFINARQVPGTLQSQYQTPYAHLAFDLAPGWTWKADYNYYSFGEGTPIGPTLPRSFRGNVYTLAVRYAFQLSRASVIFARLTSIRSITMLKNITRAGAIGLAVFFASVTSLAQTPGADTYKAKCQMCHGPDGLGNTPAGKAMKAIPFNSPDVLKESDTDLIAVIKNGKGKMPAFAGKIADAQITDVVAYIHTLQKK